MNEFWKDVIGYEGLYQVSNLGNIKSLRRNKLMTIFLDRKDYKIVSLSKNAIKKTFRVHQLVAMAFLNHVPNKTMDKVIDHINDVKTDNRLENLQIITQRENSCKTQGRYTSKYKGVCWYSRDKRWVSRIYIDKKIIVLGYFKCELAAHLAYQNKLKLLEK
jgi:hypothetical protein